MRSPMPMRPTTSAVLLSGAAVAVALLAALGCASSTLSDIEAPPEGRADLTVRIVGLDSDRGSVAAALYASARRYDEGGEPARKEVLEIEGGQSLWRLVDLPTGVYAVKAYHDRNGNGRLDYGPMGAPSEPYGFSNDARGRLGPPSYQAAAFVLAPGEFEIEVRVH